MRVVILIIFILVSLRIDSGRPYNLKESDFIYKYLESVHYQNQLELFLSHLAFKESTNNPDAFNTLGYIGKYQFGALALRDVKMDVSIREFMRDPLIWPEEEQELAIRRLLMLNRARLNLIIEEYENTVVSGILITEAGLLAAAHLGGAYGVKRFIYSGGSYNPSDAYGTSIRKYLQEFSIFELKISMLYD